MLIVLVGFLVLAFVANLVVSIVTVTLFPLLVVRVYRTLAGPGRLRPELAARGTLGPRASIRVPRKAVLAGGAGVLGVVLVASYPAVDDPRLDEKLQIIAHRGGAAVAPENTMAAFRRGIADRADWLELDVQENADGTVVIEHDRDFMRVAGVDLEVWQATDDELAKVDVGSFFSPRFSDQRVPKLRDVLELARTENTELFIELKYYGHDVNLEAKVVDLVEQTEMTGRVAIISLEYDGLRKTAALRPDWTYGLLNAVALGDLTRLDVDFLAVTQNAASSSMIRRAHGRGKKVYAWTIDDPVGMWIMMSRGVDGIITNRVELAHQVVESRARLTPVGRFIIWLAGESGLLRSMERSSTADDA
jgi:glycerophosphoryl diester phosphodiesterase